MALRFCLHPGCKTRTAGPRCDDHERLQAQQDPRPSASQRGYSSTWTVYARDWLARFPWCGQRQDGHRYAEHSACTRLGRDTRATVVDHIQSIARGGDVFDPGNHKSLCTRCNTRKGWGGR